MIGTNSENLLSSHQDSVEMFRWVEEDLEVANATLLPLAEISVPPVQLGAFLKEDFFVLLSRLDFHLREQNGTNM